MKKYIIIFTAGLLLACQMLYARYEPWKKTQTPPISLQLALALAENELAKEDVRYYCIGALLANNFTGGDWELHFSSSRDGEMWISVGSDKSVRKSKTEFQYK